MKKPQDINSFYHPLKATVHKAAWPSCFQGQKVDLKEPETAQHPSVHLDADIWV